MGVSPLLASEPSALFIQFPEVWGQPDTAADFRQGFHAFVAHRERPGDVTAIFEPNPWRSDALKELWSDRPGARVLTDDVGLGEARSQDYFWCESEELPRQYFSPVENDVRQRFPGQSLATSEVVVKNLDAVVTELGAGNYRTIISIDIRRHMPGDQLVLEWLSRHAHDVIVTWSSESSPAALAADAQLRHAGLIPAGRAWGQAGSGRMYVRPDSWRERLMCIVKESKVQLGRVVVKARAWWGDSDEWRARRLEVRVMLGRGIKRRDVLDDHLGRPLPEAPIISIRTLVPEGNGIHQPPWSVEIDNDDPFESAEECAQRHDVWPLSFSYPGVPLPLLDHPELLISPIIPGLPLTFDKPEAYLATYQNAYLGVTNRKAGWDCFRHLEIMASGAIPLMPDAESIPSYSMVHYPKRALLEVSRNVRTHGSPPDLGTRLAFRHHFETYLSSEAMAKYLLRASGLEMSQRVLFVDERLPQHADYLSVMTLIGLKQLLGTNCVTAFPVDYVYEDSSFPVSTLYGRGFGYTRVLPVSARSREESQGGWESAQFDAVVVGSVCRNSPLAADLLKRFPANRTVWIHGEDTPPLPDAVRHMRSTGAHVFVRAIHTGS